MYVFVNVIRSRPLTWDLHDPAMDVWKMLAIWVRNPTGKTQSFDTLIESLLLHGTSPMIPISVFIYVDLENLVLLLYVRLI